MKCFDAISIPFIQHTHVSTLQDLPIRMLYINNAISDLHWQTSSENKSKISRVSFVIKGTHRDSVFVKISLSHLTWRIKIWKQVWFSRKYPTELKITSAEDGMTLNTHLLINKVKEGKYNSKQRQQCQSWNEEIRRSFDVGQVWSNQDRMKGQR